MRRQRSLSFYSETVDDYLKEYNKKKSISERRRLHPRSYDRDNNENIYTKKNNDYTKQKNFQSYDDLELENLGVNSTYQIATIERKESEETEGKLIQKLNKINLSFKQHNNNSFFSNLTPFTKNIIGPLEPNINQKDINISQRLSKNIINNDKTRHKIFNNNHNDEENDDDYCNLIGIGSSSYQMRYIDLKKKYEDDSDTTNKNNSIIRNTNNNENNSFCDNNRFIMNNNDLCLNNNIINENNKDSENNCENETNKKNNYIIENTYDCNENDDKKMRRYTFDIKAFIPDNNYYKEEDGDENQNQNQNKMLQNFISKNEFLSKNIDYVDEHLKFLITGSDNKTKHLFVNQLLNEKTNYEEDNIESFIIFKKVIKLLGDYIKLELFEEDCSLCYSHMLNTYTDFSDGIILIINMNIPSSAKYIYDIIDKIKYKINKDKRHFNVILLCFEIIVNNNLKAVDNNDIKKENNNKINNDKSKDIINNIINEFEIKPNYITFHLNEKNDCLKNEKFELVINKFLSIAYLKKERKIKKATNKKRKNLKEA